MRPARTERPDDRVPLEQVGEPPDPRLTFANERTFLAWNRTALALIGAGFAVIEFVDFRIDALRYVIGLPLIVIGGLLAYSSFGTWERNERCLRRSEPLPYARTPRLLAWAIAATAVIAVGAVVVDVALG
jgi:inner membrane protein YidH